MKNRFKYELIYDLMNAAEQGNLKLLKELEKEGADIHAQNDWALQKSSRNGHIETVKYLIDRGADVKADDDYSIQYAASNGHTAVVKTLLDKGSDIHAGNDFVLKISAKNRHQETTTLLIVDYNIKITPETNDWLVQNKCEDTLKIINSRDLSKKISSSLKPKAEQLSQSRKMKL